MSNLEFTFGIITSGDVWDRVQAIIDSIVLEMPAYRREILVIGGSGITIPETRHFRWIPFDEAAKSAWITKKKNDIAKEARFDNLVLMHDYHKLDFGWYRGWCEFGDDWDIAMNRVLNIHGKRHYDWMVWNDPESKYGHPWTQHEPWCPMGGMIWSSRPFMPPYTYKRTANMYVPGGYFLTKRQYLLKNPLAENLCWSQGEDVEWSLRLCKTFNYKMNALSSVSLLKEKGTEVPEFDPGYN